MNENILTYKWNETSGGPHVLLDINYLPMWGGTSNSHYEMACSKSEYISRIIFDNAIAYSLGGDFLPLTWIPSTIGQGGVIVRWIACNSNEDANAFISMNLKPTIQSSEFFIEISGKGACIIDAAINGAENPNYIALNQVAGRYMIITEEKHMNENWFVFHYLIPAI